MLDSVNRMQESIQVSLAKAEKDNNSIFLQRVPNFGDIPLTQGALLVKATPPTCIDPIASVSVEDACVPYRRLVDVFLLLHPASQMILVREADVRKSLI
jgi:hypothetical protein